jgi:hypothetical protein
MGRRRRRRRNSAPNLLAADDARNGSNALRVAPAAPGTWMHMHFGGEEMFFV